MLDPLSDTSWKAEGKCYDIGHNESDKYLWDSFFADSVDERRPAQEFCEGCPVQQRCLKFALETQQLWGVWGGRDESEIRRDLRVNSNGTVGGRARFPRCPWCRGSTDTLAVTNDRTHEVSCTDCGFTWKSLTTRMGVEENTRTKPEAS